MTINVDWQAVILVKFMDADYNYDDDVIKYLQEMFANVTSCHSLNYCSTQILIKTDRPWDDLVDQSNINAEFNKKVYYLVLRVATTSVKHNDELEWLTLKGVDVTFQCLYKSYEEELSDAVDLSKMFRVANKDIVYENSLLFCWDHGFGFGILMDAPIEQDKAAPLFFRDASAPHRKKLKILDGAKKALNSRNSKAEEISITKAVVIDDVKRDENEKAVFADVKPWKSRALTMDELAIAIRDGGFSESKVDVIVLSNCFMMMIDTIYALRNSSNYLIAGETALPFHTFNFDTIFTAVKPDIKQLVKNFISYVSNTNISYQSISLNEKIFISGINLSLFTDKSFWSSINGLSNLLLNCLESKNLLRLIKIFRSYQNAIQDLTEHELKLFIIDGLTFLENLVYLGDHFSIENKIQLENIKKTWNDSLGNNSMFFYGGKKATASDFGCTGFSLFFPNTKDNFDCPFINMFYNEKYPNIFRSELAINTTWPLFLSRFYSLL